MRPVEQDNFHEVRRAAENDERPEQPEDPWERHIAASADKVDQHERNGDIRKPDQAIGEIVKQDQPRSTTLRRSSVGRSRRSQKVLRENPPDTPLGDRETWR